MARRRSSAMRIRAGYYNVIRLKVAKMQVVVDGKVHDLEVPEEGIELAFKFHAEAGKAQEMVIDFDAKQSIQKNAQGGYELKPVLAVQQLRYRTCSGEGDCGTPTQSAGACQDAACQQQQTQSGACQGETCQQGEASGSSSGSASGEGAASGGGSASGSAAASRIRGRHRGRHGLRRAGERMPGAGLPARPGVGGVPRRQLPRADPR